MYRSSKNAARIEQCWFVLQLKSSGKRSGRGNPLGWSGISVKGINRRIVGDVVEIHSVGSFFDSGQNTVYFGCSARELRNVWNKPDFPFNPHLTVYDSDSGEFARRLFSVISRYKYRLRFRADELEVIESRKGQESFSLALAFNSELVSRVVGRRINAEDVHALSQERRLELIDRLSKHLATLSGQDRPLDMFPPPESSWAGPPPPSPK